MSLFRRRRPENPYAGLRAMVLGLDPATQPRDRPRVYGALLDMGTPDGVATLVALADGGVSLYTSTGGGVIGAGSHAAVAEAARAFLDVVERDLDAFEDDPDDTLPEPGQHVVRAMTYDGRKRLRGRSTAAWAAAQGVLTQVRLSTPT